MDFSGWISAMITVGAGEDPQLSTKGRGASNGGADTRGWCRFVSLGSSGVDPYAISYIKWSSKKSPDATQKNGVPFTCHTQHHTA